MLVLRDFCWKERSSILHFFFFAFYSWRIPLCFSIFFFNKRTKVVASFRFPAVKIKISCLGAAGRTSLWTKLLWLAISKQGRIHDPTPTSGCPSLSELLWAESHCHCFAGWYYFEKTTWEAGACEIPVTAWIVSGLSTSSPPCQSWQSFVAL